MEVNEQVIAPEVAEESLEDTIRNAMAPPVEEAKVAAPVAGETQEQTDQRARDNQGRFAKGEKITLENAKVAPITADQGQPIAQPGTEKAPERWPVAAKEMFASLPPEVKAAINLRETTMHKELTKQDDERLLGKRIKDTASPYLAQIQAEGGNVEQAFTQFLNTALLLRGNDKQAAARALHSIAQQYNVDLGIPLQQGAVQTAPAFQPQQVSQLVQAELRSWHQNQEQSQLQREVVAFASEPGHEHFETVKPIMAALLNSEHGPQTLQEAYDQAVWANPDIRSTLTARQVGDVEQKRLSDARAKADAAKRAGGSVSGGPGNAKALNGTGGNVPIEETIRAAIREASGRV